MILADWNVLGILTGEQVNYKAGKPEADIVGHVVQNKNGHFIITLL